MLAQCGRDLEATKMKLAMTKEEIEQTRQTAALSWLESAPIIDELEKKQRILARTKKQVHKATAIIASLGSLLETTTKDAELREDGELKNKTAIEEMSRTWQRDKNEMEMLVVHIEEEKREKMKLMKQLGIKMQSLRTLQLKHKAVDQEIEAFKLSLDLILAQASDQKAEHELVTLTHEEFRSIHKKIDNEKALADMRVAAKNDERQAAEESKVRALKRLETLYKEKQLKDSTCARITSNIRNDEASAEHPIQVRRRARGRRNKKAHKNKLSILQKIIKFLCSRR